MSVLAIRLRDGDAWIDARLKELATERSLEKSALARELLIGALAAGHAGLQGTTNSAAAVEGKLASLLEALAADLAADLTAHPNGVRLFSDSFAKTGALDLRVSRDACGGRPDVVFRLTERDGSTADRYRVLGGWSATDLYLPEAHQDRLDERWPVPECDARLEPIALVQFEPGCAELTPLRRLEVAAASEVIKQINAPPAIRLIGFADTTGDAEANRRLARQRAQSVADALEEAGIAGDIAIEARGEAGAPAQPCRGDPSPCQLNRSRTER